MQDFPPTYDTNALLSSSSLLPRKDGSAAKPDRLARAAVQFESVLLGQWLQSAEKSFATVPCGEDDEDQGGEQMMGFAMQQLAGSIAASGGLGIARLVQRGLEKAERGTGTVEHTPEQAGSGGTATEPQSARSSKLWQSF